MVHALDESQPQAQGVVAFGGTEQLGTVHVGVCHLQAQPPGVMLEGVHVPDTQGLLVEQGHEELPRVIARQPGHLVGGEGKGDGVALG